MTRDWLKSENFRGTRYTVCQDCSSLPTRKPARGQQARRRRQRSSAGPLVTSSSGAKFGLLDLLCNDESALAKWLCWCEELSKLAVTDTGAGKTPLDIMAHVSDIKKASQRWAQACAWFWAAPPQSLVSSLVRHVMNQGTYHVQVGGVCLFVATRLCQPLKSY